MKLYDDILHHETSDPAILVDGSPRCLECGLPVYIAAERDRDWMSWACVDPKCRYA